MVKLIFIYLLLAVLTACIMEWLKKGVCGYYAHDGIKKTAMPVWKIRFVALLLSLFHAMVICMADNFTGIHWWLFPAWSGLCYFGQYVIDMTFIKKAMEAVLRRLEG